MDDYDEDLLLGDLVGTGVPVVTPTGETITVLNEAERAYYMSLVDRYQTDLAFQNVADVESVKLIVALETALHRWTQWLLSEKDYSGRPILPDKVKRDIKDVSVEVRQLKEALGIDRKTRERDHGETIADMFHNLGIRARKFGIMRNEQAVSAITLWLELVGLVTFYQKSSPAERIEFHINAEDVVNWIITKIPEFNKIDAEFRKTEQQYWIRDPLSAKKDETK